MQIFTTSRAKTINELVIKYGHYNVALTITIVTELIKINHDVTECVL